MYREREREREGVVSACICTNNKVVFIYTYMNMYINIICTYVCTPSMFVSLSLYI